MRPIASHMECSMRDGCMSEKENCYEAPSEKTRKLEKESSNRAVSCKVTIFTPKKACKEAQKYH